MLVILIGWLGTALYLINHSYISVNKNWRNDIYYGGNMVAAIFLIASSFFTSSWQAVFVNSFWAIISIALLSGINLSALKINKRLFHALVIALLAIFLSEILIQRNFNLTLLGWTSAFIFSGCYLLFTSGKMLPRFYLCWNAFAAITLLPQLWLDGNWPVFSLEIAWTIISLYGAFRRFEEIHLIQ